MMFYEALINIYSLTYASLLKWTLVIEGDLAPLTPDIIDTLHQPNADFLNTHVIAFLASG